jgi:hypothetical protein
VTLRPRSNRDKTLRIFSTTYNTGPATSAAGLGALEDWIPDGFQIYVIVS